jgi:signal transduction histidine kinase
MADILQGNATAQRDFLANAAHQLQTPLTSLNLLLEQVERDGHGSAEPAAKARTEVEPLSALVGDLLVLTKAASIEHAPKDSTSRGVESETRALLPPKGTDPVPCTFSLQIRSFLGTTMGPRGDRGPRLAGRGVRKLGQEVVEAVAR